VTADRESAVGGDAETDGDGLAVALADASGVTDADADGEAADVEAGAEAGGVGEGADEAADGDAVPAFAPHAVKARSNAAAQADVVQKGVERRIMIFLPPINIPI
jgi:hypothetical protein